jgi:hypothetical protein
MLERRLLERMPRPCRVEQVAGEHRVEGQPAERDAVPSEDDQVELQVVADLANALVFEERPQTLERFVTAHLLRHRGAGQ